MLLCHEGEEEDFHLVRFHFGVSLYELACSSNYSRQQLAQELRAFANSVEFGIEGCLH